MKVQGKKLNQGTIMELEKVYNSFNVQFKLSYH